MKTTIVYLSDLHFKESTIINDEKISDINNYIRNKKSDNVFLIIGGDIAFSGKKNEYLKAEEFINKMLRGVDNPLIFSVPGNHDLDYGVQEKRLRDNIINMNEETFNRKYNEEINKLQNYLSFTKKFEKDYTVKKINNVIDKITITSKENFKYNIYLYNNSLFTYINKMESSIYDNEKGLLYFPLNNEKIENDEKTINLLVMHFPESYFMDESIERLKSFVEDKIHFVFTAHEHRESHNVDFISDIPIYFSNQEFHSNNNNVSNFSMIEINEKNRTMNLYKYDYDVKNKLYEETKEKSVYIQEKISSFKNLKLNQEYVNELYYDDLLDMQFYNFFTLPKLKYEFKNHKNKVNTKFLDKEELSEIINLNEILFFVGEELSGKTTLLKKIHKDLIKDKLVIYLDGKTGVRKSDIYRLQKELNLQYINAGNSLNRYQKEDKVILIDNFDYISIEYKDVVDILSENFGKIIFTVTKENNMEALEHIFLNTENSIRIEIESYFKVRRDELISNIYKALSNNGIKTVDSIIEFTKKVSNVIENNKGIFKLNPYMIVITSKYLYSNKTSINNNIFNEVFTAEITLQIDKYKHKYKINDISPYTKAMQKIAFNINIDKNSNIDYTYISKIVNKYNEEYGAKVEVSTLIELMKDSKIFIEKEGVIFFTQENYLAYFASEEYVKLANNYSENKGFFVKLLEELFIGVNSKILLFIALKTQNDVLLMEIVNKANMMFDDIEELDLGNFPFLNESKEQIIKLVDVDDKKRTERKNKLEDGERQNKKRQDKKTMEPYRGVNYKDSEKIFHAGINYSLLIATILPNFISDIKLEDQNTIVKTLYELPNKVLYEQFKYLNDEKEEIINFIYDLIKESIDDEDDNKKINKVNIRDRIYYALVGVVRAIILSLYDSVANRSYNENTKDIIERFKDSTNSHRIQRLMFKSKNPNNQSDHFKEFSINLSKIAKEKKDILLSNSVRLIVRNFVYNNEELKQHGDDAKFLNEFFDDKDKKTIMRRKISGIT